MLAFRLLPRCKSWKYFVFTDIDTDTNHYWIYHFSSTSNPQRVRRSFRQGERRTGWRHVVPDGRRGRTQKSLENQIFKCCSNLDRISSYLFLLLSDNDILHVCLEKFIFGLLLHQVRILLEPSSKHPGSNAQSVKHFHLFVFGCLLLFVIFLVITSHILS